MRKKVRWKDFCRDHGVSMSGNVRKNEWLEVRCPFCGDKHTKGAINLKSSAFTCWKCGSHKVTEFVSAVCGIPDSYKDTFRTLRPYFTEFYDNVQPRQKQEEERQTRVTLKDTRALTLPGHAPLSHAMRAYLKGRGFRPKYMEQKYGLKDGGFAGEWAYRLMIPVYQDGRLVTWQGRHIGDNKIRYKSASNKEALNIKDTLYNIDNCHLNKVIAVEGVFDCWRIGDDCVALFGISLKDSQIKLLAEKFDEVYLLFDPEKEAQERARTCARKLNNLGVKAHVICMSDTDSEDPAELSPEEVVQLKREVFGNDYDTATPWLISAKEQ